METVQELSALGEAALKYAAKGWRVFPLSPRGKIPMKGTSGFKDATTDEVQVRQWWTEVPNANIGFATGQGIHVLDIDGEEGEDALRLLELENDGLPPTRICRTGRGRHFYFIYMGELGNTANKLGPKVDTRGDGGYVILPPSVHESGTEYEWVDEDAGLAQMPEWLIALAQRPDPEEWAPAPAARPGDDVWTLQGPGAKPKQNQYDIHPYVADRVQNRLTKLASTSEGGRNDRLFKAAFDAGRYVAGGFGDEMYLERETKRAAVQSGLDDREIEKTWRSGFNAGLAKPWTDNSKHEYPDRHNLKPVDKSVHPLLITWGTNGDVQHPQFFWGNRIAKDSITLIAGDSGIGKSQLCLEITKAITDGVPLYDDQGQTIKKGRVLWACYEDGPVFGYRLKRAGVDSTKVGQISGPLDENGHPADFGVDDIASLEATIEALGDIQAVFLDPWNHLLDGDENRREDNLRALSPLIAMAERQKVAVIIVAHTSKRKDGGSKDKISGHKILTNKVRSILYVARQEATEDADEALVAVAHAKHNWSKEADTLTFSVGEKGFAWAGTSSVNADELAAPKEGSKLLRARSWIRMILSNGPIESKEFADLAREEGHAPSTLERAKKGTAKSIRHGTGWAWALAGREETINAGTDEDDEVERDPVSIAPLPSVPAFGLSGDEYDCEPF